jgi:hypothetical protein
MIMPLSLLPWSSRVDGWAALGGSTDGLQRNIAANLNHVYLNIPARL